jgi:hypothetical protein
VADACGHGNEPSDSITFWEFVAQQLLASDKGHSSMELVLNIHN